VARDKVAKTPDGGLMDGSVNRVHVLNDTLAYAFGHRIYT